jgi:ribosome-binding factor A
MPKEYSRGQRIADLIQRELSHLIQKEVRDPRIGLVTVNEVKVSRDLAYADVYVTLLDRETAEGAEEGMAILEGASGFLRTMLARILTTRTTPKLRFHYDESLARGQRLTELINKARKGDQN